MAYLAFRASLKIPLISLHMFVEVVSLMSNPIQAEVFLVPFVLKSMLRDMRREGSKREHLGDLMKIES